MSNAEQIIRVGFAIAGWAFEPQKYTTQKEHRYYSARYRKWIIIPAGFVCDGATWSPNLGQAWLYHDYLFATQCWADGSPIKWRQANRVMQDIMIAEGWGKLIRNIYRSGIRSKWSLQAWQKKSK